MEAMHVNAQSRGNMVLRADSLNHVKMGAACSQRRQVITECPPAPGPSTHAVCLLAGTSALRTCEQPLQCEIAHQLGHDPVRYDLTGWLHKAKPNLAALDAPQVLQHSSR